MNAKSPDQTPDAGTQAGGATNSLGAQLRRVREERGISLREISDYTRISMRHLEAIESDNYKNLPGGLFNRSFIKAYAKHVNFDENTALEAYARTAREHGAASDEALTSPTRSRIYMDGDTSRSPWLNIILSGLMLGIIVLGGYAALHWYKRTDAPGNDAGASSSAPATNPNSAPVQAPPQVAPSQVVPSGFNIQVKAKGEDVWMKPFVDDAAQPDFTLKADQTREFTPQQRLLLRYSPSKTNALEVSVNGQAAKTPTLSPKGGFVEWAITKDGYRQFMP